MRATDQRAFEAQIYETIDQRVFRGGGWLQPLADGSYAAYDGVHTHWVDSVAEAVSAIAERAAGS